VGRGCEQTLISGMWFHHGRAIRGVRVSKGESSALVHRSIHSQLSAVPAAGRRSEMASILFGQKHSLRQNIFRLTFFCSHINA
jgi:hypothetical protein